MKAPDVIVPDVNVIESKVTADVLTDTVALLCNVNAGALAKAELIAKDVATPVAVRFVIVIVEALLKLNGVLDTVNVPIVLPASALSQLLF